MSGCINQYFVAGGWSQSIVEPVELVEMKSRNTTCNRLMGLLEAFFLKMTLYMTCFQERLAPKPPLPGSPSEPVAMEVKPGVITLHAVSRFISVNNINM